MKTSEIPESVRCFLLVGDDSVSRELARDALIKEIEAKYSPVAHERFDSTAENGAQFGGRMLSPSLFQETRIFHVSHAEGLSKGDLDDIAGAISPEVTDVFCVVEAGGDRKEITPIIKRFQALTQTDPPLCAIEEFASPPEYKIADWLVENVPKMFGRRIARNDAEFLADRAGYELTILHAELQKIDLALPAGKAIDRAVIDSCVAPNREMDSFELAAALGRRDAVSTMRIISAMFTTNVYLPLILSALARHFWSLFRIKKFLAANPDVGRNFAAACRARNYELQTSTGMAIGIAGGILHAGQQKKIYPVLIKSGIVDQAGKFSESELSAIIGRLFEFDIGIKTGRVESDRSAFELLCYRIIRAGAAAAPGWAGK